MKIFLMALFISGFAFAEGYESYGGVRIHSSCLEQYGTSFPELVRDGLDKGLQCLRGLNLTGVPRENLRRLEENYGSKLMIACHEPVENFPATSLAHGSLHEGQTEPSTGLVHPYFSINSKYGAELTASQEYFEQVIFHETIHNLGYGHGRAIEYAYSCEECCFNSDPKVKAAACRICSSEYKENLLDEKYARDLMSYASESDWWKSFGAERIFRSGILAKPESPVFREVLLRMDWSVNPLSILSAKMWKGKFVTPYLLNESEKVPDTSVSTFAAKAAEARSAIFDEQNLDKAYAVYLELNPQDLAEYRTIEEKKSLYLGKAIMADMDSVWTRFSFEQQDKLDVIYKEIKNIIGSRTPPK